MKTGILIGCKGRESSWVIDVLVEKKYGKYTMLLPEIYREYREVTRMKWRDFQIEEEGLDSSYEEFEVNSLRIDENETYDIAKVGNMKKDAIYRVVYREDKDWEGIYHVRLNGYGMDTGDDIEDFGHIDHFYIKMVNQIVSEEVTSVNMEEGEKRELLKDIKSDVQDDSVKVMVTKNAHEIKK